MIHVVMHRALDCAGGVAIAEVITSQYVRYRDNKGSVKAFYNIRPYAFYMGLPRDWPR